MNNSTDATGKGYLKLGADFGSILYDGKVFESYMIKFNKKSEHSFGKNMRQAELEMQVYFVNDDGVRLNVSILFDISTIYYSEFLDSIGIGNGQFSKLKVLDAIYIERPISLENVFAGDKQYYIYEGTDTLPPCDATIWFV